jgi:hypothetical protein
VHHPFSRKDSSQGNTNAIFYYKIPEREEDLGREKNEKKDHPLSLPGKTGQGEKEDGIDQGAATMEEKFWAATRETCRKTGAPLMKVKGVKGAQDTLRKKKPDNDAHFSLHQWISPP